MIVEEQEEGHVIDSIVPFSAKVFAACYVESESKQLWFAEFMNFSCRAEPSRPES
jgi:hypothetical protein